MDYARTGETFVDLTDEDDCVLGNLPNNESNNCHNTTLSFKDIYNENKLVAEFIKKCLNMEESQGMERIINNIFMKIYREANEDFKVSPKFNNCVRRTLRLLDTDPYHKFSHIKNLCDTIKGANTKKRVLLTTLESNVKEKQRRFGDVIDLDENEEVIVPDVPVANNAEKENNNIVIDLSCEDNVPIDEISTQNNQCRVSEIEKEIEQYKQEIDDLDSKEVTVDSAKSPYIRSESLKAKVVTLYEELCRLTGHEAVKKRSVHLKVLPEHPKGPVKRLERFLNRNIGKDGVPRFPDFRDVVLCVHTANAKDKLGWSQPQIMQKATALFTQCGQALQKHRQKREWRDLLCKVKLEDCPRDPADDDPELRARLEANRQLAKKKESDVFARYCMLQSTPSDNTTNENLIAMEDSQLTDKQNEVSTQINTTTPNGKTKDDNILRGEILNNFDNMRVLVNDSVDISINNLEDIELLSKLNGNETDRLESTRGTIIIQNDIFTTKVQESDINDNEVIKDAIEDDKSQLNYKSEEIGYSESSTYQSANSTQDQEVDLINNTDIEAMKEPEDIIKTLNGFGENYTLTVILDEDPFLVIEVSSDSSEDEQD